MRGISGDVESWCLLYQEMYKRAVWYTGRNRGEILGISGKDIESKLTGKREKGNAKKVVYFSLIEQYIYCGIVS